MAEAKLDSPYKRFQELARKLTAVPKQEVDQQRAAKSKRVRKAKTA